MAEQVHAVVCFHVGPVDLEFLQSRVDDDQHHDKCSGCFGVRNPATDIADNNASVRAVRSLAS